VHITLHEAQITARPDTIVCPNTEVPLYAYGGNHYDWYPAIIVGHNQNGFYAIPQQPQYIYVTGTDSIGCSATDSFYVDFYPPPFVNAGEDIWLVLDSALLQVQGVGNIIWQPSSLVTCDTCHNTIAFPDETTTFTVTLTDSLGCTNTDDVTIFVNSNIWVPNAFTPDGDGTNDYFYVKTFRIKELTWYIFDRWGEEIFKAESINSKWDGTYMENPAKQDVYVYKIYYTDIQGVSGYLYGTVTLLR
jgi:gliding motility-associated-like protein